MAPSNTSAEDAPAHRYQLRQRRAPGASHPELSPESPQVMDGDRSANATRANNSEIDTTAAAAADGGGPPSTPKARVLGPGLSPRPDNYASDNMFRAAKGSDLENMLLFREQPRQLAVLAIVVTAVSYFSFTHDSQVRIGTCYGACVIVCILLTLLLTQDVTENVRNGLSTGVLIFLVYCFLQTRDGLMVRSAIA